MPSIVRSALVPIAKAVLYSGSNRWCPVCEKGTRKFRPFGSVAGGARRDDAMCPWCGSLERHRLAIIYFREKTNLFDGAPKRLLHVAPENKIEALFRDAVGDGYLSGDLMDDRVMEKLDITDIHHPDDSFDVIYCSHVLEHVPDDRLAIREFYRVLKPGGWAMLNVPVTADKTFEDPTIEDPAERERLFGQYDHVRRYGPDYEDRLKEGGFQVQRSSPSDIVPQKDIARFGLSNDLAGDIYFCTK